MKNIKINWLKHGQKLCQIYSKGVEFALVSDDYNQCIPFVMCRDWLQDAIYGTIYNKEVGIYGFKYDPSKMPKVDLNKTRIVVVNSQDDSIGTKAESVIDFINQFERHLKLERTKAVVISDVPAKYKKGGGIYFEGSKKWMMAPPMISLYTLLIRVGFVHTIGETWRETVNKLIEGKIAPYQTHDSNYLKTAIEGIDNIMTIGYRPFFFGDVEKNYPEGIDMSSLHNNSGIVSMSRKTSKNVCKHWTRPKLTERIESAKKALAEAVEEKI